MWIIIYCKQGRYFPCHPRWYMSDFPPSTHISTWYVLKFNKCFCEFWCFGELLPKDPCCPVYKLAPPSLTSQNLHFYAPSMQPFEVLQAFLCCIPLSWVWFPGNSLRCRFLCQYLLRKCFQEKPEMEQGRHNRTGKEARPRCGFSWSYGELLEHELYHKAFLPWGKGTGHISVLLVLGHFWKGE